MPSVGSLAVVFVAGLLTALATGIGAVPFFLVDEFSDRWNVALWGIASGIMVSASLFGLFSEGLAYSSGRPTMLVVGIIAGAALVEVSDRVLDGMDVDAGSDPEDPVGTGDPDRPAEVEAVTSSDPKKLLLILGILTVHSFPEGVAVGVSFAELGLEGGVPVLGFSVPVLAVFMTVAISIHNVPEGTAIAIPMRSMGLSNWRMVGAAVFSSLPQPVGAVIAFAFVRWAESFLPFGYGFAAGAMVYLVVTEFVPEALEAGAELRDGGRRALLAGFVAGVVVMVPLLFV